jgi:threonine/homoserine/homoserine lactone efflux protein
MILTLILEGILYGLFLSILIGPLLVTLVDTSVKHGIKKAMCVAGGIWFSDILFILSVAYLSVRYEDVIQSRYITYGSWVTGLVFLGVGLLYLIKKDEPIKGAKWQFPLNGIWQFWKGFLVNTINPFTLVFWSSVAANQVVLRDQSANMVALFFITILVVIIFTDTLKVILANRISFFLKVNTLGYLRAFSGLVFLVSGGYVIYKFCL